MNRKLCLFGARRLRDSAFLQRTRLHRQASEWLIFSRSRRRERSGVGDRVWRLYFFFGI